MPSIDSSIKEKGDGITIQNGYTGSVPLKEFHNKTLNGDYVAKGIGLYFGNTGTINLNIHTGATIENAFLYWAVDRENTPINHSITLNNINIIGYSLGTVEFHSVFKDAFRADVTNIVNENTS